LPKEYPMPKKKKKLDARKKIPKDGKVKYKLNPELAVVIYPALGNPAIVRRIKDGDTYTSKLNLIILCQVSTLTEDIVAQHLKISTWGNKDKGSTIKDKTIHALYEKNAKSITLSECYSADTEILGLGPEGQDNGDERFGIKLNQINMFPWVLKGLKKYPYLYKITVDLKNISRGMHNIWWVNTDDYHETHERPEWWNLVRHIKDYSSGKSDLPRPFKKELKAYGGDVIDTSNNPKKKEQNENIKAAIYHPFFVTTKKNLSIGHVTDIHLDSRMEVYGQCEASVIEVNENCPPVAAGNMRKITNNEFHVSLKKRIANFNNIFKDICEKLIQKGADMLVITGDLVDYNRGLHTPQTHRTCFTPISEAWKALSSKVYSDEYYKDDRNWFMFYKKLLELYDKPNAVPIFTMLGNHDYVNYGMAPWPLAGLPWNGVFDQNLTLYESALCFGEGYNSNSAFVGDVVEKADYVEWYAIFINPFTDYVVNVGDLSLFMVDWGIKSNIATSVLRGSGGLHHARHLFKKKSDFDRATEDSMGGSTVSNYEPFPLRNYSIYESWIKQKDKVKILFMHATGICPKDDVSIGQINHDLKWTDSELRYGSFDNRREEILNDVEKGALNMIVAGHSHRNVVMEVDQRHTKKAKVLGAGELYGTVKHQAKNLVMVTSSGGPLPKYIPGGPKICACPDHFNHGWDYWDYDSNALTNTLINYLGKNKFYKYTYEDVKGDVKEDLSDLDKKEQRCGTCGRLAKDMEAKKAKRHRPGGSLITFNIPPGKDALPMVAIESIPSDISGTSPRRGVMGDEHKIFTQGMKMEHIDSYREYTKWEDEAPISIISRETFIYHGYMEFPDKVRYVTFTKGRLGDSHPVKVNRVDGKVTFAKDEIISDSKRVVRQYIGKEFFEYFMIAAQEKVDFAFARYTFNNTKDTWDREIKMYKEMEKLNDNENDELNSRVKDPYKGLVMTFLRNPDLEKRKRVCGY